MGRYDEVDPEDLRRHLVRIAKLILRLEDDGVLLQEAARLQKVFGDLRQKLFAYEVRSAADLAPSPESDEDEEEEDGEPVDPLLEESLRIVREAREREQELRDELGRESPVPENEEDDDEDEE